MDQEIIQKNGVYLCPKCGSKRVTEYFQAVLQKAKDVNTGTSINLRTNKPYKMSNREKAQMYDMATTEGVGCWSYECRKCGWSSQIYTE